MERVTILKKVRNEEVRSRLSRLLSSVEKKHTQWARKVNDMTDDWIAKKAFVENMPGKRPR